MTLALTSLSVGGPGKQSAELIFSPGLNVIVGASNTGKSYVFQCIDYLLGSKTPPKESPHSSGFNRSTLRITTADGHQYVFERSHGHAGVLVTPLSSYGQIDPLAGDSMSAAHQPDSANSLSQWLLEKIGLSGLQIRKNTRGERINFTFRHVAHLAMVDENRIIREGSPATTGDDSSTSQSAEQRAFNALIAGEGDGSSGEIPLKKKDRNLTLDGKIEWITAEIGRRQNMISVSGQGDETCDARLKRIDEELNIATSLVSAAKEKIVSLEQQRRDNRENLIAARDRMTVIRERLKRFEVLLQFYDTDAQRIQATVEAGHTFERLPSGHCAVCGMFPNTTHEHASDSAIDNFVAAATSELTKLATLSRDLRMTMEALKDEDLTLVSREGELVKEADTIAKELQEALNPQSVVSSAHLRELVQTKSEVEKIRDAQMEVERLKLELMGLEKAKKQRGPAIPKLEKVTAGSVAEFCQIVTATLRAWQYPLDSDVSFDPKLFDLIINNQSRGSLGKGHRALTHAAFNISLLRYCQDKGLPHPGFVILDSPLNPYRGQTLGTGSDAPISRKVQDAFYGDLANCRSGEQYIIMENTPVPNVLIDQINHIEFTGNAELGRSGFFPALDVG